MNEEENIFEEDVILPDDFEEDKPIDESKEDGNEAGNGNGTSEEPKTDEQKLLDFLNAKEIKYNGEAVKLDSLDKFIDTFQKGMNYDNLKSKTEKSDNTILNYVREKAKSMQLTPEQYIEKVKNYEEEQVKAKNEQAIQSMVANGIPEDVAREVVETRALRQSLLAQQADLKEKEEKRLQEEKQNKEYEDFLNAYPGIEVDKIPNEVFGNAKNSNLKSAYAEYENKILKEKLKILEQNQKNASSSVVKSVTDTGTVEQQGKDAFLDGFDSI